MSPMEVKADWPTCSNSGKEDTLVRWDTKEAMMELHCKRFDELTTTELYEILRLRVDVFVAEQECARKEIDGKDNHAYHFWVSDENGLQGYWRVLEPGINSEHVAFSRMVVRKRGCGLARQLLTAGLHHAKNVMGADAVTVTARYTTMGMYEKLGFHKYAEPVIMDGTEYVPMKNDLSSI